MKNENLSECIIQSMEQYFADLEGGKTNNLYDFFICEVEKPFLTTVMQHVQGNQSKAAQMLGINRNTLRKKLQNYNLLDSTL